MSDLEQIAKILVDLPRNKYRELIQTVDHQRRRAVDRARADQPATPEMTRDEFANWLARQHYLVDMAISRILYLPTNSPANKVRLVEVNELAGYAEDLEVEPFNFSPDINGLDFVVGVADVSPGQFRAIQDGRLALPVGWELRDAIEIPPVE